MHCCKAKQLWQRERLAGSLSVCLSVCLSHRHSSFPCQAQEVSDQYARLLGHQNMRQKIHYVKKIRDENSALKMVSLSLSVSLSLPLSSLPLLPGSKPATNGDIEAEEADQTSGGRGHPLHKGPYFQELMF